MREISVRFSREVGRGKGDAAKALKGRKPELDGVSGQQEYVQIVCWNCWAVNEVAVPATGELLDYVCWNCGVVGVTI